MVRTEADYNQKWTTSCSIKAIGHPEANCCLLDSHKAQLLKVIQVVFELGEAGS